MTGRLSIVVHISFEALNHHLLVLILAVDAIQELEKLVLLLLILIVLVNVVAYTSLVLIVVCTAVCRRTLLALSGLMLFLLTDWYLFTELCSQIATN